MAGTTLTGSSPSTTYDSLLKFTDNSGVTGSLKTMTDGLGADTALQVSTAGVKSTGTLDVTGVVTLATALPLTGGGTGATSASTARTALGLGTAAVAATGDFDAAGAATTAQAAAIALSCQRASNLSDVASASTARTNLGLGTAATSASTAFDAAGAATTAQAAAIAASCQRASNLSDLASAATARTNLGMPGVIATADGTAAGVAFVGSGGPLRTSRVETDSRDQAIFFNGNGNCGAISTNGLSTAYNTSSDARLKTNIRPIGDVGTIIDAIQPRRFDWISGSSNEIGFIAQELHLVLPSAVKVGGDDERTDPWSVDKSMLIPLLVAEIQATRLRLAALEAAQ